MIINWGDAPFKAFITVTYPHGTCTVTGAGQTYTHTGGGTTTFTVKKKGTYTVKATNTNASASSSVTISTHNESKSVTLTYVLVLYDASNYSGWTQKARVENYGTVTFASSGMTITGRVATGATANAYWVEAYTSAKRSRTSYTKLKATISSLTTGSGVKIWAGTSLHANNPFVDISFEAAKSITATGTVTLDISSLSTSIYAGIIACGNSKVVATKVWFES